MIKLRLSVLNIQTLGAVAQAPDLANVRPAATMGDRPFLRFILFRNLRKMGYLMSYISLKSETQCVEKNREISVWKNGPSPVLIACLTMYMIHNIINYAKTQNRNILRIEGRSDKSRIIRCCTSNLMNYCLKSV